MPSINRQYSRGQLKKFQTVFTLVEVLPDEYKDGYVVTLTDSARLLGTQINLRLTSNSEAVLAARRSLDRLEGHLLPEKLEDVRLVVSELVTNSVRHAGLSPDERISLAVMISDGSVRGRVCDPGPGFEKPSAPRPRTDLSGGWGLPIVERISDRWGVERNGCACVWFEID
jgi:anti-sigma regulatory factor (Ser/Thr protein kinase)